MGSAFARLDPAPLENHPGQEVGDPFNVLFGNLLLAGYPQYLRLKVGVVLGC